MSLATPMAVLLRWSRWIPTCAKDHHWLSMALRLALIAIALGPGGFMLADGTRNLLAGTYSGGGQLGPWSLLVTAAGIDSRHFGAVFVLFGLAWLAALAGLLTRRRWAWPAGVAIGVGTLWYVPVGTLFALAWLALLVWRRLEMASAG